MCGPMNMESAEGDVFVADGTFHAELLVYLYLYVFVKSRCLHA